MTIGDSVIPTAVRENSLVSVSIRTNVRKVFQDSGALFSRNVFDIERSLIGGSPWSGARLLGRRSSESKKISLRSFLDLCHDVQINGTPEGLEAIAIPFAHIALLSTAADEADLTLVEEELRQTLAKEWPEYVDPLLGYRVRYFDTDDFGDDRLVAYCGRGVFLPDRLERPTGAIELTSLRSSSPLTIVPQLPNGQAAGLYRGQAGLAFSHTEMLTVATAKMLPEDPAMFFFCQGRRSDAGGGGIELRVIAHKATEKIAATGPTERADYWVRESQAPPGFDGEFHVDRNNEECFALRYSLDARLSRLRAGRPVDAAFRIVGIVSPAAVNWRLDRWWIDLDSSDQLVGSSMSRPEKSIIVGSSGIWAYDWRRHRRNAAEAAKYRLVPIKLAGRASVMLCPLPGRAFGYLTPPAVDMAVVFGPDEWGPEAYGLDWLDFSGAGEDVWGNVKRLGEIGGLADRGAFVPGHAPDRSFAARPHWTAMGEGDVFEQVTGAGRRPGERFIVGPLCLEVSEGNDP
jgi:hypothetical protein